VFLINDDESGLHHEFDVWLEKLAPHEPISSYRHNNTGEDNADAQVKDLTFYNIFNIINEWFVIEVVWLKSQKFRMIAKEYIVLEYIAELQRIARIKAFRQLLYTIPHLR
jgi:hypothetical protein